MHIIPSKISVVAENLKLLVWNHVRCQYGPLQNKRELKTMLFTYLNLSPFTCTFLRLMPLKVYIKFSIFFCFFQIENDNAEL